MLNQRPDVILLGGDIVDDVEPLENALSFFEVLSRTGVPAYLSPATTTAGGRTLKTCWRRSKVTE